MLNTKSLCSRRDPLWIAAFCFKQLKKAQVFDTDIPSCVGIKDQEIVAASCRGSIFGEGANINKILQEEMGAISYRVLAYLLLGVVRIYSKRVEYLWDDCNEVLLKMNKFVISTKMNAQQETLSMSFTIPERFELDAFDLDILEDDYGGHIAPQEKITLKEVLSKTERFGQFSLDKFEDFDSGGNTSAAHNLMVEDIHNLMSMDFEVLPPNTSINLGAGKDKFQNSIMSPKEPMNFDTVLAADEIENESTNLPGRDQEVNEDQAVQEVVEYEVEIHKKRSKIAEEESTDISMSSERVKETVSVEAFNEYPEVDDGHSMAKETSSSSCQMHQEIIKIHEARDFQESIGRPQDDISSNKECVDHVTASVAKVSLEELTGGSVEEQDKEGKLEFQLNVSFEDGTQSSIPAKSKNLDVTPQSKFQGHSVGRSKSGNTAPGSMLISTPVVRERALFSRKRKRVLDEVTVLPNEVIKRGLIDTSDLLANRRKFRQTMLSRRRQSRISRLPDAFNESFLPCSSPLLKSLFSNKKLKIRDSLQIVETPGRLDVSESQTVGSPEHVETAPRTPPQRPDPLVIGETSGKLDVPESQTLDSSEHIATAPQTPPLCQNIKVRSIEIPRRTEIQYSNSSKSLIPLSEVGYMDQTTPLSSRTEIQYSDNLGPSHANTEREESLEMNEVLEQMEKVNIETSYSDESVEGGQFSTEDEELNLNNEEINSSETENSELLAGWSERTRKVASYLHRRFEDPRKQEEGDGLNFSQVLGGRDKKDCARMFYELLVLRTTSHVDVKQEEAYADIAVSKLPKFDQTFQS